MLAGCSYVCANMYNCICARFSLYFGSLNCSTALQGSSLVQLQQLLADMRGGIKWQSSSGAGWLPVHFRVSESSDQQPSYAMPPQHTQRLWDQCFKAAPAALTLRLTLYSHVPPAALDSDRFCFAVALTEGRAAPSGHHPDGVYAASEVVCMLLMPLFDNHATIPALNDHWLLSFASPPALSSSSTRAAAAALPLLSELHTARVQPLSSQQRRVCYFSHYDRSGNVAAHVLHLLDAILLLNFHVVLVTCSPMLTPLAQRQLQARDVTYIVRRNIGRDFGSWAVAFQEYPFQPESEKCDQNSSSSSSRNCDVAILLANDSVLGPFFPLFPALAQFFSSGADLFGLTESLEVQKLCALMLSFAAAFCPKCFASLRVLSFLPRAQAGQHLQSYFLLVSHRLWYI